MSEAELHARASTLFLALRDRPAAARAAALEAVADARLRAEVAALLEHDAAAPDPPANLGPYRVVGRLGRGGSGQVFLCEQDEPVRRRLAVKVVPEAAVRPELAARFEVERRALERMEHPHVAAIRDAGRTPEGLPWIAMDHVEGEPITAWCEARGTPVAERVRLVADVADAVQHAHQRGVIHRDLKPANVLVTGTGGQATPCVLDFGIAKPVGPGAPDLTATGLVLGTPAYMAPEQTAGGPVDTRTDVHALGALLYELLAGRPPVAAGDDPLRTLTAVREHVPPPPSRARTLDAPAALRADLDSVVAKALEKDPDRRYATAAALADDLRRALASEPVAARRPTAGYRLARFARRHRGGVAAAALVSLAVATAVVGLARGKAEAEAGRRAAVDHGRAQGEINRFLTDDLLAAVSPFRDGRDVTVLELLGPASARIDERFPDRPLVRAALHHTLGETYAQLGEHDEAERHLERALAIRGTTAGADAPDTIRSEIARATLLFERNRLEEARDALLSVLPRARLVLGADDPELYRALDALGVVLETLDRPDEAVAALEEALAGRRRLLGPGDVAVATTLGHLANAHDRRGEPERTLALLEEALALVGDTPDARMVRIVLQNDLAVTYQDLNRDAEAAPHLRAALESALALLGEDHPATLSLTGNLAGLETALGDPERGLVLYAQVAEKRAERFGPTAYDTLVARYGYWDAVRSLERYADAALGFGELLANAAAELGEDHWLTAQTRASLAHALVGAERYQEAWDQAARAEAALSAQFGPDHVRTRSARSVMDALADHPEVDRR